MPGGQRVATDRRKTVFSSDAKAPVTRPHSTRNPRLPDEKRTSRAIGGGRKLGTGNRRRLNSIGAKERREPRASSALRVPPGLPARQGLLTGCPPRRASPARGDPAPGAGSMGRSGLTDPRDGRRRGTRVAARRGGASGAEEDAMRILIG